MVLESTVLCIDSSEFMRNGDFVPTRMQVQQDAANLLIKCKLRANPENCVGLVTMAPKVDVKVGLTHDDGKLMAKLHQVQPKGASTFLVAMRVAQLVLKHRQNRNHKTRIIIFVGSPLEETPEELIQLAKKFKKEKLFVDVVSFGEDGMNGEKLKAFIETINGKDSTTVSSHMVVVPSGCSLQEALMQSAVVKDEDGQGPPVALGAAGQFDFGMMDADDDPELAMALRVSLEEQRLRQEQESRQQAASENADSSASGLVVTPVDSSSTTAASVPVPNFEAMTEEEQMEYALRISMSQERVASTKIADSSSTEVQPPNTAEPKTNETSGTSAMSLDQVASDPNALQAMLETLTPSKSQSTKPAKNSAKKSDESEKKPDKSS